MAEGLAFSIAEYIIPNLTSFAVNEIGLIYGCRDDLKMLEETLSAIKAVLLDAEDMQEKSHFVKDRIKLLEEVLYDADDLLDYIATEGLRRKLDTRGRIARQVCDFFSPSSNHLAFRHKIGHAIREIRGRLDEIANDISKFNFVREKTIVVGNRLEIRERGRETDSFVMTSEVIGRDKEKKEIIDMLMGSGNSHHVPVLPIVGLGGLGKTALAKLVYNDESVVKQFEPRIWVCVSEDFDSKLIIQSILRCITNEKVDDSNMEQLQTCLRKNLDGKKYLLVLDDVWNEDSSRWIQLERLLMVGANGSKIVVTARSSRVAYAMGINEPYILNGLTEDQSWKLFESLAFGKGLDKVDSKLVKIGKEIINKCKGVPLAIKTLGSTMRSKIGESEWLSIQNNEIWSLSLEDSGILPVLKLSYDHLPTHLKFCFAYCSIFPKDYKIKYHVLIQLWMAQGYIQSSSRRQNLEYIADHYFRDLLSRSFFQEVEVDDFGNITKFKMHDFIHDLAKEVAGNHCCSITDANDENNYERVRHVSLQVDEWRIPRLLLEEKGMRTFFISSLDFGKNLIGSRKVIAKFRRIRALDLHRCAISKVQGLIGSLKHLRYLDLSRNYMKQLPNSISNLVNLQTLILSGCQSLIKLPRGVTKLINLRYLMIDDCGRLRHMPTGLGKLTSLRMLSKFEVSLSRGCGRLPELSSLKDLRGEIEINNLEKVRGATSESKQAKLNEKPYLQSLKLHWGKGKWKAMPRNGTEEEHAELVLEGLQPHSNLKELRISNYRGAKLGSWMMGNVFLSSLPNLVSLTLINFERCQHLPALDQLSCLKFLRLERLSAVEDIGGPSTSFPRLTKLTIIDCPRLISMPLHPHLEEWVLVGVHERLLRQQFSTSIPSFSNLKSLHIAYISDLEYLPDEVLQTSLQVLKISNCDKLLRLIASEEEEGFRSLTSLRSLHIQYCHSLTSLSRSGFQHLTALEKLSIYKCNKLLRLTASEEEEGFRSLMWSFRSLMWSFRSLTSLRSLDIRHCNSLTSLSRSGFQHLTALEELSIYDCNKLLRLTASEEEEGFRSLTSLRSLTIWGCNSLTSLSRSGFQHLTALEELTISNCNELDLTDDDGELWKTLGSLRTLTIKWIPKLATLPEGFQHFTALEDLTIDYCKNLKLMDDGFNWQALRSLRRLQVQRIPDLVSLPKGIQHLTTLQHLIVSHCSNFVVVPEWILNLTSLKRLILEDCPGLTSLPQEMCRLTSLLELLISGSPDLEKRCKNKNGKEWNKIAHIPNITIDFETIQGDYIYW